MLLRRSLLRSRRAFSTTRAAAADGKPAIVHTWGTGTDGQLGHYPFEKSGMMNSYQELSPRELQAEGAGDRGAIIGGSCGTTHTAALSEQGAVFTWGKGQYHQLGHGGEDDCLVPREVEALAGVDVKKVSCGTNHTAVLDAEGQVWTWGYGGSGGWFGNCAGLGHGDSEHVEFPKRVEAITDAGLRARDVTCGERHTVIVTDDDQVWLTGAGEYGRMGNGGASDQSLPEPVDFLQDFDVAEAVAGHSFTLALTRCGKVFSWGRNDQAQLGLGGGLSMDVYAMESFPNAVEGIQDAGVVKIAAGNYHAAAITEKGELYMWGMKRYLEPELFTGIADKFVTDVSCGQNFTAIRTEDGEIYTFGGGRTSGLGHGDKKTSHQPMKVEALSDFYVTSVACGSSHVMTTSWLKDSEA